MWFIQAFQKDPEFAMMHILIIVFSVCCHEYMHARTALWQGDNTAKLAGHLTLNPLKQMGMVSLVLLFVAGIAFGQVPVNPGRLRHRHSDALVSFAGPFANLVIGWLFFAGTVTVIHVQQADPSSRFLVQVLFTGAELNLVLFMLNMIPVPPLDGFGIAQSFFPAMRSASSEFLNGAYFFIIMAVFFSAGYLFRIAVQLIVSGLLFTGISPDMLRFYFA